MADTDVSDSKTFFTEISPRYPKVDKDGKLDTQQFLEACRSLLKIYDHFGAALIVAKKDMSGNIEKLHKVYNKSPEKYSTLNDLIFHEKDDPNIYAVDALLWLRRALAFIYSFMQKLFGTEAKSSQPENVYPYLFEAYSEVLKPYHNWFLQNTFKVLLKAFPNRSEFVKTLTFGNEASEDALRNGTRKYLEELFANIEVIDKMYHQWGLNMDIKV